MQSFELQEKLLRNIARHDKMKVTKEFGKGGTKMKRIKILLVYFIVLSLLVPGSYVRAEEAGTEDNSEVLVEEYNDSEEPSAEDSEVIEEEEPPVITEEADSEEEMEAPVEETIEEDSEKLSEESSEVIEAAAEEEPVEEEPEAQIAEVTSAEEAALALVNLEEDDPEARLIVFGDSLPEDTGASEIIYYEEYDEYILQFSSPEEAAAAQEDLAEEYEVFEDEVLTLDNLLEDEVGDPTTYSWGTSLMGVDPYLNGVPSDVDSVTVAVVDTGVDPDNPFFDAGVIRSDSWDVTSEDQSDLTDSNGHGTHVCGIVADMTPNQVKILAVKVWDNNGSTRWSWVITGLQYCLENDVDVINLSIGADSVTSSTEELLNKVLGPAKENDIIVVCAAGNDSIDPPMIPARMDTTVAVSAIDRDLELYYKSNYGESIDLCAPGVSIKSAAPSTTAVQTTTKTGTSMASPHIAAIFAYLKLAYPDASWDELVAEAEAWAIDIGPDGWDAQFGWGYPELTGLFNEPLAIEDCTASLDQESYMYTGNAIEPSVTLAYDGRTLTAGNEYTVSYSNNIMMGQATVTVIGQRRFSGTITLTFDILPGQMKDCTVSLSPTSFIYDGKAKEPSVTVTFGEETLVEGTDYDVIYENNVTIGKATVTITGKGSYTGSVTKTFTIQPIPMKDCTASLSKTSYTYDGNAKKPSVTVTYGEETLVKGTDYDVVYANNKAAGKATVTITGKGIYTGSITKTFTIQPVAMKSCKASLSQTSYTYNTKARKPAVTVTYSGTTLVKDTDFTVSYKNNINIGKATVTISGKGNYTGSITKTFKIVPATVTQLTPVAGIKKMTVKYKTVKGDCRYQIAYRVKGTSTWTKVNTTLQTAKTIKKLKSGKTYQVKVRAYKKVDDTTYIGAWSEIMTVKVK